MANDKDPVFCAADIIKRAKLAKEFKTRRGLQLAADGKGLACTSFKIL